MLGVVVLYMNLRDATDFDNWPRRDEMFAGMLEPTKMDNASSYEIRCHAFFAALFTTTTTTLMDLVAASDNPDNVLRKWQQLMDVSSPYEIDVEQTRKNFESNMWIIYKEARHYHHSHDSLRLILIFLHS